MEPGGLGAGGQPVRKPCLVVFLHQAIESYFQGVFACYVRCWDLCVARIVAFTSECVEFFVAFATICLDGCWVSMEKYATVDESAFPLVRITFTGSKSNDGNFQDYLDQTKNCYRHKQKFVLIFDASRASIPSFRHQKMQGDWLRENKQMVEDYCLGTAYVIPSAAIRTLLKMIFSFQRQSIPYQVFETNAEAEAWVKAVLANNSR